MDGLYERVAAYVAEHPGEPVGQIAAGVKARVQSVRFVLRMEGFSRALLTNQHGREHVGYYPATVSAHGRGRAGTASQNGRLLAILADGEWHRSDALHAAVLCVLHSRVAELRRRGHLIEHRGGGAGADQHWYRLLGRADEAAA